MDLAQQDFNRTVLRQIQIFESGTLKVSQIQSLGQPFGVLVTLEAVGANGGQVEIQLGLSGTARNLITMLLQLDAQYKNAPVKWLKPAEAVQAEVVKPEVAPLPVVELPPTPMPAPEPVVVAPAPPPTTEPQRIGTSDFTIGRHHEHLVPPSKLSLTEQNPIAFITQRRKVGWAVVESRYFLKTDLETLFVQLQKAVPATISAHVISQVRLLKESLLRADSDKKVTPRFLTSFTGGAGIDLLFELTSSNMPMLAIPRHQKNLAVSQQDRRIVIPLAPLVKERRPRTPTEEEPASVPAPKISSAIAAAPPATPVSVVPPPPPPQTEAPPRPVIPRVNAENEIQMMLPPGFNLRLYSVIESDLFRHLRLGLPYHMPDPDEEDVFQQIFASNLGRVTYLVRYRISPLRGGGRLIEVLTLDEASNAEQKTFWRGVAETYGFGDITYDFEFNKALMVRAKTYQQIHVSKQVHAKLVAKHELSREQILQVLGQLRSVSPSSDNPNVYNTDVKIGREQVYRVGVAMNQDTVILTTLFRVQ